MGKNIVYAQLGPAALAYSSQALYSIAASLRTLRLTHKVVVMTTVRQILDPTAKVRHGERRTFRYV